MLRQYAVKKSGFTLIEVVLVLAIGALIILMATIAFRGAQRSRRNTARTNLANQIKAAVESYAADNSNAYPDATAFNALKTKNSWADPLSGTGGVTATNTSLTTSSTAQIIYAAGSACTAGTNAITGTAGTTVYAIQWVQENGTLACTDSTK